MAGVECPDRPQGTQESDHHLVCDGLCLTYTSVLMSRQGQTSAQLKLDPEDRGGLLFDAV